MRTIIILTSIITLFSSLGNLMFGGDNVSFKTFEKSLEENGAYDYKSLTKFIYDENREVMENSNNISEDSGKIKNDFKNWMINKDNNSNTESKEDKEKINKDSVDKNNEKVLRIVTEENPKRWNDKLRLEEWDYKEIRDYDNTYGYLIGKNPTSIGNLHGEYEYETVMISSASVQYPNIFILDKSYGLEDKSALSFRTEDELIRFVLNSKENINGWTAETLYNEETKGREVVESKIEDNKFEYYMRLGKDGYYKVAILEDGMVTYFLYEFPDEYKKALNPMIEQSKKSFKVFNEYPSEIK